ncbi:MULTISPECIES: acyl-CoA dehydrogenase family protein [Streptomyces]|uniref:Acyl-CoA dehydrogenase n=1 Tax=Streptomyces rimosus subsp. rimosus (strain ATCC 10970 / DSM 40260 / JCM 4667 / NRRL 2234) TaxID=1265868 RepID=A0A8A1UPJ8_STRR1|nr:MULTISPECIES: acyl-CoA dehydrogenase family protein [Streptomyces]MYT44114.1 acyl-CoA dehydrogenase [Streptomyces sp. SID5471]QDA09741.1 acyl-CoA dehydrogenase [Streptomyces rimosus]QEV81015.1 acyl-CoA dehydrogenase [Streptomyces rimosus]QST81828.1 acyl-CoA dehydrogenase [Streptomyces rimosus subsp. rimosus ATCC 10970]QTL88263.1 acyl-CoA dehydrogenase [Streptomyces rimosus subsp. rimosus]
MDFSFGTEDAAFREEARCWLAEHLGGDSGRGSEDWAVRRAWERELGRGGWVGIGWGRAYGGFGNRAATLAQQVVWAEEYAAAGAPERVGHIGENLLAPTLIAYGDAAQRDRFLPSIARGEELWCQGYSEPGAGSDLAAVCTVAVRDGDVYRITGQKIWTSLAREADWIFVLARTDPGERRHRGLSFLLVPMDQPGRIEVRSIRQLTGTAEFNEVFFDGAVARAEHVVGGPGDGWRVATGLLALERGVSTLAQQVAFGRELDEVIGEAVRNGAVDDPVLRDRLVRQWAELRVMRWNALRTLGPAAGDAGTPSVAKLLWAGWHQRLGELAMHVRGAGAASGPGDWSADAPYELDAAQRRFLFSRADTIYGGSDEIQRGIIAGRVLGLDGGRKR